MFSPNKQTYEIMELSKQQNHTESIIIKNSKLLDGLLNQLEDLSADFKDLEESIRVYQKAQIDYSNDIDNPKKKAKDKNHGSASEIKKSKESTYEKEETRAECNLERISFAQNEVTELLKKINYLNEKNNNAMQLVKPINDKNCSHCQKISILKSQLGSFYELLEEVKYFDKRHKDLLEDKQEEVKRMIAEMTSVWSNKSKQLEENVIKLTKSISTLKKTQRQNLEEGMKKIKTSNLNSLMETINQIQAKYTNTLYLLERKLESMIKDHSVVIKDISTVKSDLTRLEHENYNLQEKLNPLSSQLTKIQKEMERERLRSRLFEEEIKKRMTDDEREKEKEKEEKARKMKEWEEKSEVWQTYAKHMKNQLVTLEERLRHLNNENAQKVKTHDFEEIRKLQELLSERDAAIGGIREALEFLISKVHDPFIAGIGL